MANMKVSAGRIERGIVAGNTFDKYGSRNPIVRLLMRGYRAALDELVAMASPHAIHEVGCGEGYWTIRWRRMGMDARGSDFSEQMVSLAAENAASAGLPDVFSAKSVYDLESPRDAADLVVCCEVLEHLQYPENAFEALARVVPGDGWLILSVPREPIWRAMNLARGRYVRDFGNTPGHLQHWSQRAFVDMASGYFEIVAKRAPIPWTMLLCRPRRIGRL